MHNNDSTNTTTTQHYNNNSTNAIVKATNFYILSNLVITYLSYWSTMPFEIDGKECVWHWTFLSIAWKDGIWHPFVWSPILSSFKA